MDYRLKRLIYRSARPLLSPFYTGVASILMFHHVVDDPPAERAGWPADCEVSSDTLARLVQRLRARGHAFVGLDELREALLRKTLTRSRAKLVVVTFDDGYASVYHKALPLLEALRVPFTVYVITSALDGTLVPWWYLLERQVLREPPAAGYTLEFLRRAAAFEHTTPDDLRARIEQSFSADEVARACADTWLTWDHARALAHHPLVTVGAHTVHHRCLTRLSRGEALGEIRNSRRVIEERLAQRVRHFAYPFGAQQHAGPREFALARECGFDTGVTTRLANVFPAHADHLEALPRVFGPTLADIELAISGALSAFVYRGRRVVST